MEIEVLVKSFLSRSPIAAVVTDEPRVGFLNVGGQNDFIQRLKITSLAGVNIWRLLAAFEMV